MIGACARPLLVSAGAEDRDGVGANRSPHVKTSGAGRSTTHLGRPYKFREGGHMLKLGYKASAEQFAPRQLLDFAVHAEAVDFDSIMVSDHFQPWRHTGGHGPFSFAWLGALGERTA